MDHEKMFLGHDYFRVNVREYDNTRDFWVTKPASLANPQDHAVMFIQKSFMGYAGCFGQVENCLVFWPETEEVPEHLRCRHVFVKSVDSHLSFCSFFKDHHITNRIQPAEVREKDHYLMAGQVEIGEGTKIFPYVYMHGNIHIGKDCYIGVGARIIGNVYIGDGVMIKENTVIGADGLTTDRDGTGAAVSMPQFGGVIIEDDVQIGANSVVARGAIDNTVLSKGCKIDNSVFISHNNFLGENVFMCGESTTFGSVSIGKNTLVSGNAAIRNGLRIGEGCLVGSGAMVTRDVADGETVMGNPAKEIYFPKG